MWSPQCTTRTALKNQGSCTCDGRDSDMPSSKQVPLCGYDKLEEATDGTDFLLELFHFGFRVNIKPSNRNLLIYCNQHRGSLARSISMPPAQTLTRKVGRPAASHSKRREGVHRLSERLEGLWCQAWMWHRLGSLAHLGFSKGRWPSECEAVGPVCKDLGWMGPLYKFFLRNTSFSTLPLRSHWEILLLSSLDGNKMVAFLERRNKLALLLTPKY